MERQKYEMCIRDSLPGEHVGVGGEAYEQQVGAAGARQLERPDAVVDGAVTAPVLADGRPHHRPGAGGGGQVLQRRPGGAGYLTAQKAVVGGHGGTVGAGMGVAAAEHHLAARAAQQLRCV